MTDILNIAIMLATIAFGAIGWIAPRYAMATLKLDLRPDSKLGLSEIRAANGALFVGVGLAALIFAAPVAYAMVGAVYAGAALGRLTSILVDGTRDRKAFGFFALEALLAIVLIALNV